MRYKKLGALKILKLKIRYKNICENFVIGKKMSKTNM